MVGIENGLDKMVLTRWDTTLMFSESFVSVLNAQYSIDVGNSRPTVAARDADAQPHVSDWIIGKTSMGPTPLPIRFFLNLHISKDCNSAIIVFVDPESWLEPTFGGSSS